MSLHQSVAHLFPTSFDGATKPLLSETERRVLDALRRDGAGSRAALARTTGLAKPSVSRIVEDLIARGLISTGELRNGGRGKPGLDVRLVSDAVYCVGISLMTDAFVVSLMDLAGAVHAQTSQPFARASRDRVLDQLAGVVDEILDRHVRDRRKVFGIGLGVTGFFVDGSPRVNPPSPLDEFALIDLRALLEDRFDLPVMVENDGSTAAVGEMLNGVGAWTSNFAYLYFSAGFGGGVVLGGQLWRGVHGNAGEFAGMIPSRYLQPNLETLRRQVAASGGPDFDSLSAFINAFDMGLPGVLPWLEGAGESLTLVCAAIHATLDVDAVVLGGRIPTSLLPALIERIDQSQTPRRGHIRPKPRIVPAESQSDATSTGAAASVFRNVFF